MVALGGNSQGTISSLLRRQLFGPRFKYWLFVGLQEKHTQNVLYNGEGVLLERKGARRGAAIERGHLPAPFEPPFMY